MIPNDENREKTKIKIMHDTHTNGVGVFIFIFYVMFWFTPPLWRLASSNRQLTCKRPSHSCNRYLSVYLFISSFANSLFSRRKRDKTEKEYIDQKKKKGKCIGMIYLISQWI
ncbi:hypothetical protein F5X99DRAFT_371581 [Biscogniauxia marginata]|nr:hypothetical protein F5X99DRAFT_371581 [Biscogniauxia marginata]